MAYGLSAIYRPTSPAPYGNPAASGLFKGMTGAPVKAPATTRTTLTTPRPLALPASTFRARPRPVRPVLPITVNAIPPTPVQIPYPVYPAQNFAPGDMQPSQSGGGGGGGGAADTPVDSEASVAGGMLGGLSPVMLVGGAVVLYLLFGRK